MISERIAEIQDTLEKSQSARFYPDKYIGYRQLSTDEYFRLWEEMWCLMQMDEKTKSVGS